MQTNIPTGDFYSRFYDQLKSSQDWPGTYLFKFIVKSGSDQLENLKSLFESTGAVFTEKKSSKNTFTSLSIKVTMSDPDQVIEIYKKSSTLEGVIAL